MVLYLTPHWTNNNPHYKSLPQEYLVVKNEVVPEQRGERNWLE